LQAKLAVEPTEVEIPFASLLAERMPIDNIKVQRDFPKVLAMVRACALVHRDCRDRNASGNVVASRADYEAIYELLAAPSLRG
jgi:hypothetical protein